MNDEKYWNPKENEELCGILIEKLPNKGKYHSNLYKLKCDGEIVNVWGKKQLDALMRVVNIGDKIILKYVGNMEFDDYYMKRFELEILNE